MAARKPLVMVAGVFQEIPAVDHQQVPNFHATGVIYGTQPNPAAKTVTGTLTIAELLTLLITSTAATAVSYTLPTGTLSDAGILGGLLPINGYFDWSLINLGSATGVATLVAGTGHTIVGAATVAISTTQEFRTRKTAANTFVTYRK